MKNISWSIKNISWSIADFFVRGPTYTLRWTAFLTVILAVLPLVATQASPASGLDTPLAMFNLPLAVQGMPGCTLIGGNDVHGSPTTPNFTCIGDIGIGTTTPGEPLDVMGIIRGNGEIVSSASASSGGNLRMIGGNYGAFFRNDGANTYFLLTTSGDQYGMWNGLRPLYVNDVSGAVTIDGTGAGTLFGGTVTATAYYHSSDMRLKQDIHPVNGLAVISHLKGVNFKWRKDNSPGAGVLAQDVELVMPSAVRTNRDGYMAVDYDQIMAPVIEAIKELKVDNDRLAAKVAKLEKERSFDHKE